MSPVISSMMRWQKGYEPICRHIVRSNFVTRAQQCLEFTSTSCTDALQASALRDYQFFQAEGQAIFSTPDEHTDFIAKAISQLDDTRSELTRLPADSAEAKALSEFAGKACDNIGRVLLDAIRVADFNIRIDQALQVQRSRKARRWAAIAGGCALVIPMTIMIRFSGLLPTFLTTYVCVFAVGFTMAFRMRDSQPKDIFACVAAYAAVLVVFVGTGQSSSDAATGD